MKCVEATHPILFAEQHILEESIILTFSVLMHFSLQLEGKSCFCKGQCRYALKALTFDKVIHHQFL